jgi:hypothetical protein
VTSGLNSEQTEDHDCLVSTIADHMCASTLPVIAFFKPVERSWSKFLSGSFYMRGSARMGMSGETGAATLAENANRVAANSLRDVIERDQFPKTGQSVTRICGPAAVRGGRAVAYGRT